MGVCEKTVVINAGAISMCCSRLAGKSVRVVKSRLLMFRAVHYFSLPVVNGQRVELEHILKPGDQLEFLRLGMKGNDDVPWHERLAEAVVDGDPELQAVANKIRDMDLGVEQIVPMTMALVKDHFENIYGPIGPGQQPVLREVAQLLHTSFDQLQRIAERLDGGSVSPAALDREAAAKYLGVELKTLDYLVRRRKIRYVQVGEQRGRVFRVADLNHFLSENLEETAEEILQKRTRK